MGEKRAITKDNKMITKPAWLLRSGQRHVTTRLCVTFMPQSFLCSFRCWDGDMGKVANLQRVAADLRPEETFPFSKKPEFSGGSDAF